MKWFKYEPFVPCRPDVYGEGIFVRHWQQIMREPLKYGDGIENEKFESIISPWGAIADDAAAASSLVCWLGTNCGRAFLDGATKRAKTMDAEEAFSLSWANHNRRMPGWNGHRRTIEAIIPAEKMTLRAVEMVEIVVRWLGEVDGQRMISLAEAEIEETSRQIFEQQALKWRAQQTAAEVVARRVY